MVELRSLLDVGYYFVIFISVLMVVYRYVFVVKVVKVVCLIIDLSRMC